MNEGTFRGAHWRPSRKRGTVDAMDVVVGVVLVILIPLMCYVVSYALGLSARSDKLDFREKPTVPIPPPDAEEVEARWAVARDLYRETAKKYLVQLKTLEDGVLKDFHRQWVKRCMENSASQMEELARMIEEHPETRTSFARYLGEMDVVKKEIAADLEVVNAMDILKLDAPRTMSEREVLEQSK